MGDENPIRALEDYFKPSHEGYRNTIELPEGNNIVPSSWCKTDAHSTDFGPRILINTSRTFLNLRTINQSAGGKLRDLNPEESWEILEDLALYDNESWNDPRDFAKLVKEIALPQDVPSTSDRRLIELENQVQRLMEAYLASTQPTQVNKITTPCEICSGPHDTQNCMENLEQAFVEYASSHTDEAGGKWYTFKPKQNNLEDDGEVMFIEIIRDDDEPQNEDPNEGVGETTEEPVVEYFDTFLTRDELTYHREDANEGISNFTGRIKGMHVFIGNFTYIVDFMIVEDISSIIDPRMSQVDSFFSCFIFPLSVLTGTSREHWG
ncbi:hypothetical protein Tco_1269580 [Tanacetum coccineum]